MKDERIEQAKNKIRSEMTVIIIWCVAISFFVKTLVFKMGIRECITEYLILILSPFYQSIRLHMLKVSLYDKHGKKQSVKKLIMTTIFLVVASVVFIVNSAKYHSNGSIFSLFPFSLLLLALLFIFNKFNQQLSNKNEKDFDDDK